MVIMPAIILTLLGRNKGSFCDMSFDFMSRIEKYIKRKKKAVGMSSLFRPESRSSVGSMRISHETTVLKHSLNLEPYFLSVSHEIGFDYVVRLS